ncbi:hypothetical protein [Selenomonas sp. AB3002]|uniref:hypothetical protein n=1 Tax=Selenomonas sp. AB3002 TaxID=1392502 RepID=UPI0004952631
MIIDKLRRFFPPRISLPRRSDYPGLGDRQVMVLVLAVAVISFLFRSLIFAPLVDFVDYVSAQRPTNEFHESCARAALQEIARTPYAELKNDQFILQVKDREVLCRLTAEKGQEVHYFMGLVPYHKEEDSAGPVLDQHQSQVGRKVILRFSAHGDSKFSEFVKTYLAAPNGDGYPVFEPYESYEERQGQLKERQQEALEQAKEQARQEADSRIRRVE